MSRRKQIAKRKAQSGAALLIAIFALLLISVVAIALVVTSGTDAALGGNYRTSAGAYYAGAAGLEEARGRLLWKNPNYINITNSFPTLMTPNGLPSFPWTQVFYILNPTSGEIVDPLSANPADYPDTEYATEFGPLAGANVTSIPSVWQANIAGLPGPSYKWVRITPATEKSLNVDVNGDGSVDPIPSVRLFYESANLDTSCKPSPGLVPEGTPVSVQCGSTVTSPTATAVQVLEITSLAVLPNGGRRMLQYVVAPVAPSSYLPYATVNTQPFVNPVGNIQPSVPAALTLLGANPTFQISATPSYPIDGRDVCSGTTPQAAINSVGYTNSADYAGLLGQMNPNKNEYPGYPLALSGGTYTPTVPSLPTPPYVSSVPQNWQTPATLDAVVQNITNNADVVITGPVNSAAIAAGAPTMLATNPMTIVVNGDLNLNANTGYGLLLVTGTLTYQPFANWNGLILVIGKGAFTYNSTGGSGGIQGAVVVAKTRDGSGNLLPGNVLGSPSFTSLGSNTNLGIIYNSCWVQSAQGPLSYKVLSFREIPLTN